jgi:AraC-like DNA-binding protein
MRIETFYPSDKRLRTCIEYYYFLKSDSPAFNSEYYAFPNTLQALNIHKNIKFEIVSHSVKVTGIPKNNFTMLLQGRFEIPLYAQLKGRIDKVTIIFKPLGLNQFITLPFNKISAKPTQLFREWDYHEKHHDFLTEFFSESIFSKRVEILEKYLLLHYHSLNNIDTLRPSLKLLTDFNNELSIEEIAGKINMTTRTFTRMFRQHLGISPIGYRKIARFRHSLKNRIVNQQYKKLTEIGYESNFYDQSYFIKMYKKLTNTTPGKFFELVDKLADDQLILKFISR